MVKDNKKRVMISIPKTVLKDLEMMCEAYGMEKSQLISMLVVFHKERMQK